MALRGLSNVLRNIDNIYKRRERAVFAIAQYWGAEALKKFQRDQLNKKIGRFWVNQTYDAANAVFQKAFYELGTVGFYLSHGVDYGVWLELANNRKHAALIKIINEYAGRFLEDVRRLYGG